MEFKMELFNNTKYYDYLVGTLSKYRRSGEHCDIILKVEGEEFPAHKLILSASTPYFEVMFSGRFPESNQKIVELHGLEPKAVQATLNYLYTGHLQITDESATDLLRVADYMQLDWVKNQCCSFLNRAIRTHNCIAIWKLAELYSLQKLEDDAERHAIKHILQVSLCQDFLNLEAEDVKNLLIHDILSQQQHESSFVAIVRWIQHNLETRETHLGVLLQYIQTPFISQSFLEAVILKEPLLRQNVTATNWLLDRFSLRQSHNTSQLPRISGAALNFKDKNIFIMNENSNYDFYSFDVGSNMLNPLADRPKAQGFTVISHRSSIYTIGGKRTRTALRYDIGTDIWNTIPFRCYLFAHSTCVVNDWMYITGGYYDWHWQNTVLRYDFNRGKMDMCSRMMMKRGSHGSVAHRNCVYVCGGNYTGSSGMVSLSLMERMDTREGMWRLMPNMQHEHGNCTAAIVADGIYCSNNYGGLTERFDVRRCNWETIATAPGEYGSIVAFDNKLYRIYTNGIAIYSTESNSWETLATSTFEMPLAVTLHG